MKTILYHVFQFFVLSTKISNSTIFSNGKKILYYFAGEWMVHIFAKRIKTNTTKYGLNRLYNEKK